MYDQPCFTVFVTKYALTTGVRRASVAEASSSDVVREVNSRVPTYFHKGEWFKTAEEARADVEKRRSVALAALARKRERLEAMDFDAIFKAFKDAEK